MSYFSKHNLRDRVLDKITECRNFFDYRHRRFQAILKILGLLTRNLWDGIYFQIYNCYIGSLELLKKSSSKDIFLRLLENFQNSYYAINPWKEMYEVII